MHGSVTRSGRLFRRQSKIHRSDANNVVALLERLPNLTIHCIVDKLDLESSLALRATSRALYNAVSTAIDKFCVGRQKDVSSRALHELYTQMEQADSAFPAASKVKVIMPSCVLKIDLTSGDGVTERGAAFLYKGLAKRLQMGFTNLTSLAICQKANPVSVAPLQTLVKLRTLDLSACLFLSSDLPLLAAHLTGLTSLHLTRQWPHYGGLRCHVQACDLGSLTALKQLRALKIGEFTDYGDAHFEAVAQFGGQLRSLEFEVHDDVHLLTPKGLAALGKLSKLERLTIPGLVYYLYAYPRLPDSALLQAWAAVLTPMLGSLRELKIYGQRLARDLVHLVAQLLEAHALQQQQHATDPGAAAAAESTSMAADAQPLHVLDSLVFDFRAVSRHMGCARLLECLLIACLVQNADEQPGRGIVRCPIGDIDQALPLCAQAGLYQSQPHDEQVCWDAHQERLDETACRGLRHVRTMELHACKMFESWAALRPLYKLPGFKRFIQGVRMLHNSAG